LQPDCALGWTGLSSYYGVAIWGGSMNPDQTMAQAEAAAQKAVDLDGQLAEGHLILGASIFSFQWDFARGFQEESRAIELDPKLTQAIHMRARTGSAPGGHSDAENCELRLPRLPGPGKRTARQSRKSTVIS
jgi:hypothetical protein